MPTIKQLNEIWDSEFEFFGGLGTPQELSNNFNEGHGLTDEKKVDTPAQDLSEKDNNPEGEILGFLHYNKKTNEITFSPLDE